MAPVHCISELVPRKESLGKHEQAPTEYGTNPFAQLLPFDASLFAENKGIPQPSRSVFGMVGSHVVQLREASTQQQDQQ